MATRDTTSYHGRTMWPISHTPTETDWRCEASASRRRCPAPLWVAAAMLWVAAPATAGDPFADCARHALDTRCDETATAGGQALGGVLSTPSPTHTGATELTGRPAFTTPLDSLYRDRRPAAAIGAAQIRGGHYAPLPDRDGGYAYPGTDPARRYSPAPKYNGYIEFGVRFGGGLD